jgi:hypothetical protein
MCFDAHLRQHRGCLLLAERPLLLQQMLEASTSCGAWQPQKNVSKKRL